MLVASLRPPSQMVALPNPLADDDPSLLQVPSALGEYGAGPLLTAPSRSQGDPSRSARILRKTSNHR